MGGWNLNLTDSERNGVRPIGSSGLLLTLLINTCLYKLYYSVLVLLWNLYSVRSTPYDLLRNHDRTVKYGVRSTE
jgi:hypothetical protein